MAMLEGKPHLTLEQLNLATQAWVEQECRRKEHAELSSTPLQRYLSCADVSRPSPEAAALRRAFRIRQHRRQRRSDGTFTLDGVRFEVPGAYRHLEQLGLQSINGRVDFLAADKAMVFCKRIDDAIGLWRLGHGARVVNVFHGHIELVLVVLGTAAILGATVGEHAQQGNIGCRRTTGRGRWAGRPRAVASCGRRA